MNKMNTISHAALLGAVFALLMAEITGQVQFAKHVTAITNELAGIQNAIDILEHTALDDTGLRERIVTGYGWGLDGSTVRQYRYSPPVNIRDELRTVNARVDRLLAHEGLTEKVVEASCVTNLVPGESQHTICATGRLVTVDFGITNATE